MRNAALIALCVLIVGGAAPAAPYDLAAVPDASAARQRGLNACHARQFPTLHASVTCAVAAHRAYAVTEKLRAMALFEAYAKVARQAADDADAGRLPPHDASRQIAAARVRYEDTVQRQMDAYLKVQAQPAGPPLDRAALQSAEAQHNKDVAACGPWSSGQAVAPRLSCIAAAGARFTKAIKLANLARYYGYLSVLKVDSVDAEDGLRNPQSMAERQTVLWQDFLATLQ